MTANTRLIYIDALRGLAVLLMVMVHAAATWSPPELGDPTILALVVSGLGGLAAPLFVALLGWGLHQRPRPFRQRFRQAVFLFLCQLAVNLSAPHLFDPFTPGVLSLMAMLIVFEPYWSWPWRRVQDPAVAFGLFTATVFIVMWLVGDARGASSWAARVETDGVGVFFSHLVLTGTYPLLPWVVFAGFGTAVGASKRSLHATVMMPGFILSAALLVHAGRTGQVWARPTGDAVLTFFPANVPFLIAAMTGVSLLWWLAERIVMLHPLADVGRCSLTVYVVHFAPFAYTHGWANGDSWSLHMAMFATLAYTACWGAVGTLWFQKGQRWTLESVWRWFSSRDQNESASDVKG